MTGLPERGVTLNAKVCQGNADKIAEFKSRVFRTRTARVLHSSGRRGPSGSEDEPSTKSRPSPLATHSIPNTAALSASKGHSTREAETRPFAGYKTAREMYPSSFCVMSMEAHRVYLHGRLAGRVWTRSPGDRRVGRPKMRKSRERLNSGPFYT